MLKQRIITALILAPVAIAGIFLLPDFEFSLFIGAIMIVSAWEWANLAGFEGIQRYGYAGVLGILIGITNYLPPAIVLIPGLLWWMMAFVFVLRYPALSNLWASRPMISLIGILCIVPGYVAMLTLKGHAASSFLILLLFFLIWGADIGAYFSGRALGKNKLASKVSPGKTWEGLIGGLIVATLIALPMLIWFGKPDPGSLRGLLFLAGCMIVVLVSVLGDLVVSMFKRNRGIKDSSNLLPGHGGLLDRLDSLLSAGPIFALIILALGID